MSNEQKYVVYISRHPGDYTGGEYDASKINRVHWGRTSGGVHKLQSEYSLYGYVPYADAMDIVACSGRHDFGYNDMKICIVGVNNKDNAKYRAGYYHLVEQADERAGCGVAANCPKGAPICTKRIREILNQRKKLYRRELRSILCEEGYGVVTIRESIKNLCHQGILEVEGDSRSPLQVIRIV